MANTLTSYWRPRSDSNSVLPARGLFDRTRGYMMFLIFLVLWYVPAVSDMFWGLIGTVAALVGIPMNLASLGYSQFLFWR